MKIFNIIILFILINFQLKADQTNQLLDDLFASLQSQHNNEEYNLIINNIWAIWLSTNDSNIDKDFKAALSLMNKFQYKKSIYFFSRIIEKNPNFAEAWNKRATVYYLLGNYEESISDIRKTLHLEPRHFGALDGLGLIFIRQEKYLKALEIYKEILKILPYSKDTKRKIMLLQNIVNKTI